MSSLYYIDKFWPGRLALAARPRGGDWLPDEIANWKRSGISGVVSLLTPEEERDLELMDESRETRSQGLEFLAFPIPDRQAPASEAALAQMLERIDQRLAAGKNVLIHCRQGVGRSTGCCLFTGEKRNESRRGGGHSFKRTRSPYSRNARAARVDSITTLQYP